MRKATALFIVVLLSLSTVLLSSCGSEPVRVGMGRAEVGTSLPVTDTEPADDGADGETVTIVMAGDVLLHEPISESGEMEDGSYNYDHLFANVKDEVENADLALINEEVILGGRELGLSGYPRFNGAYEVGDAEASAGFDVILQATNHALDKGKEGIINDLQFWKEHYPDISVTGIYATGEDRGVICVREVKGIKIAVLNYTYSTNGIETPSGMPWAVATLDEEEIAADFEKAREQADFIIVCPHWGTEYSHKVSNSQRAWADYFAELGADLILGAHPHVIEPVEEISSPDGKNVPVFWSVGNFINSTAGTGSGTADRMVGAMAKITLDVTGEGVVISGYEAVPLVCQMAFGRGAPTTYFLSDYTEELAAENEVIERDPAFSIRFVRDLCDSILGNAWKSK